MYHLILKQASGTLVRVTEDESPTSRDIEYWENYYKEQKDYNGWIIKAVCINIYKTEEEKDERYSD